MKKLIFSLMLLAMVGCVGSEEPEEPVQAPEIYTNMPMDAALVAGIDFGGLTLKRVKKLIKRRNESKQASEFVYSRLEKELESLNSAQIINAMHLYLSWPSKNSHKLFLTLLQDERPLPQQMAWQLASVITSRPMRQTIRSVLTAAIKKNALKNILLPQMANAVENHKLVESYTLLRHGLFTTNHEDFAKAMAALEPVKVSEDFMNYLAQAEVEELRQLTLTSVNLYSCLFMLKHMKRHPVSVGHPRMGHLFLYSVSRNPALVELATDILQNYVPASTEHLAFRLSQLPGWVQLAYVENARRKMTPKTGLILSELKHVTSQRDVIDEIAMLRR
jgi:hypothetical protein